MFNLHFLEKIMYVFGLVKLAEKVDEKLKKTCMHRIWWRKWGRKGMFFGIKYFCSKKKFNYVMLRNCWLIFSLMYSYKNNHFKKLINVIIKAVHFYLLFRMITIKGMSNILDILHY